MNNDFKGLKGLELPVHDEIDIDNLEVVGKIPDDLQGMYWRNGPNPDFPPLAYHYPWDGDGMLHAIYFEAGNVRYKNRFVKTKGLLAEMRANRALYGSVLEPIAPPQALIGKEGDPGPIKNTASINVIKQGASYAALGEAGIAYEVNREIETLGPWAPDTAQPPILSGHFKRDLTSGAAYFVCYQLESPHCFYHLIDVQGKLVETVNLPEISAPMMVHDFALTKNYLLFFDCKITFDKKSIQEGKNPIRYSKEESEILIVKRGENKIFKRIKVGKNFVFHCFNAYEENDNIILDYTEFPYLPFTPGIRGKLFQPSIPHLTRLTINLINNTVSKKFLDGRPAEFARINENFIGIKHRYIYTPIYNITSWLHIPKDFNAILKIDLETNQKTIFVTPPNAAVGEPVFVAKQNGLNEDDGYLLFIQSDTKKLTSRFIILDATTMKVLAEVLLPRAIPNGLHGNWSY